MAENTNNYSFASLSEMDKIFIPQDLDNNIEMEEVANYKVYGLKFWRTVPENFRLVKVNRITQKITAVDGFGLKFVAPILTKTILVPASIIDGKQQYVNVDCLSKDKIEISVDLTLIMNITNPAKYKRKGSTQLPQLNSIINRLLRIYVSKKNFDELVAEECNLRNFDINGSLRIFEEECGIRIDKVIFEKVKLPEHLKKLYNDAAEEEQKRKAQAVRLKAEQEKAEADAKVINIRSKAEAEKIGLIEGAKIDAYIKKMNQFVETLQAKGIPTAEIAEQLKLEIASKHGNAIFMSGNRGNDSLSSNIAAGVYAGNVATENRQTSTKKVYSNSERLIQYMDTKMLITGELSESYKNLRRELSTEGNDKKKYVDSLDEELFKNLVQTLQLETNPNRENQQEENGRSYQRR